VGLPRLLAIARVLQQRLDTPSLPLVRNDVRLQEKELKNLSPTGLPKNLSPTGLPEFPSNASCQTICAAWPEGSQGESSGDTFSCRATWLQLGFAGEVPVPTACSNAGPTSPECVD
jgi:hypothetical protein